VCAVLLAPSLAWSQGTPAPAAPPSSIFSTAPQPAAPARRWYNDWFRDRGFYDPLIAEPRAPQISVNFPAWTNGFEFSAEPGNRLVWEISLGREIPVFVRANFDNATGVVAGSQGFGYWFDLSFHMIEDMGRDPSNPIVNTDYRFSLGKLKYYRVLSVAKNPDGSVPLPRRWTSMALRYDIYHHESTHLGDEFVIQAQNTHPEFERFNVSFEFYDVSGAFNWERGDGLKHSIRGGTTGLIKPSSGYYSDHTLMPDPESRVVQTSERNFEPYVQYEFFAPHRTTIAADPFSKPGSPTGSTSAPSSQPTSSFERPARWALFASADLRRRIVLDFYKASEDIKEDTQWSVNLLGGIRSQPGNLRFSIKEIYLRWYYGVNPHGQLRNQKDYWLIGLGVNFAVGDR
jgi:hypothetical protein